MLEKAKTSETGKNLHPKTHTRVDPCGCPQGGHKSHPYTFLIKAAAGQTKQRPRHVHHRRILSDLERRKR